VFDEVFLSPELEEANPPDVDNAKGPKPDVENDYQS